MSGAVKAPVLVAGDLLPRHAMPRNIGSAEWWRLDHAPQAGWWWLDHATHHGAQMDATDRVAAGGVRAIDHGDGVVSVTGCVPRRLHEVAGW